MDKNEIIQILRAYGPYLHTTNFVSDGLRLIGNAIIYGLAMVTNIATQMFAKVYKLLNFWDYSGLQSFIKTYNAAIWALATVAIAWAGLMFIHNKRVDYHEKGNNFLVAVLLFFGTTFFMTQATNLVNAGVANATSSTPDVVKLYQANITDVYDLDNAGWAHKGLTPTMPSVANSNQIRNMNDISMLNINETVDTGHWYGGSQVSPKGTSILTQRVSLNGKGTWELHNLSSWFKLDEHYYRYSWHPWYLFFGILCILAVTLITIFKVVKIEMEIGFIGLLTQGIALTDIDSGKRNRQLITKLRDSFVVLFLLAVLMQFYSLFLGYLNRAGLTPGTKILAMIGAALFIIDGPNIIQSIFGIDAGVSSVAQSMTNVLLAGRGVSSLAKGVGGAAKATAKGAGHVAKGGLIAGAGMAGATKGLVSKPKFPSTPLGAKPGVQGSEAAAEAPGMAPGATDQADAANGSPQDAVAGSGASAPGAVNQAGVNPAGMAGANGSSAADAPDLAGTAAAAGAMAAGQAVNATPTGAQLGAVPFHPPLANGKSTSNSSVLPLGAAQQRLAALNQGAGTAPALPGASNAHPVPTMTTTAMPAAVGTQAHGAMQALQQDRAQAQAQASPSIGQRAQAKLMASPTIQSVHRVYREGENNGALLREHVSSATQTVKKVMAEPVDDQPLFFSPPKQRKE